MVVGAAAVSFIQPGFVAAARANATPIGAWFGIARRCSPPGGTAHTHHRGLPRLRQAPLPTACDPSDFSAASYWVGTLQFTIPRIKAE